MGYKKKKTMNHYIGKRYDNMMGRCYRETDRAYKNYGGQGIRVCSLWIRNITEFRTWYLLELERLGISEEQFMSMRSNIQLDRINPSGHYTPNNCRLVSRQKNARNKKTLKGKKIISAEGEEYEF